MNRRFLILGGVATLLATGASCALFMKTPSVSIAGVRVSSIGLEGATETLQITLSVPFRYEDVGRAVQQLRRAGELRYRLTGRVRFDAPLRDVLVPFEQTGTMGL